MTLRESVLATLAYHDIFGYPLRIEEVAALLIENHTSLKKVKETLDSLITENRIGEYKRFYFLYQRKNIVNIRLTRTKHSSKKLNRAIFYSKVLKLLPSVHMVGISGALAMENSHSEDDIDLVVITKANLLWTTRLFTNALLFPVKRKPGTKSSNNRACLNLFLDASDLKIKDENIYQAHEICQLKPLWQRNNAYYNFINANRWVKKYLPNWQLASIVNKKNKRSLNFSLTRPERSRRVTDHLSLVEIFLKKLQLFYMRKKISTETIGDTQLFFHPKNTQNWVLEEYQKRLVKIRKL